MRRLAAAPGNTKAVGKDEFVKIRKRDLERLTTETMQIKDFLPKILNGEFLESFYQLEVAEAALEKKEQENEQLRLDCDHFKAKLQTAQADCQKERESKAEKFFNIVGQTIESFVKSLDGSIKEQQNLDSDENQFVLALAGIVTNVAAVASGREFLVNSSQILLETLLQLLAEMKAGLCTKLKVLILMCLYNVSINLKGLQYISESPGFIPLLSWLLEDPDAEVCLHVLRLIQSVILEPEVFSRVATQIHESLSEQRILELSSSRNPDLRNIASELLEDMKMLHM
ncbi:heat shock factor 2-binding protein isoform X4 [Chiloscyllium punctatum]|uniref:heat shock factor 2-binding protein isoform X4 n=1 Tax=Chiloscyllium punctatum TaxID=137246 RepID=UPI003B63D57F